MRTCPLCRVRLPLRYSPTVNYSLLSLVEKIEQHRKPETLEKDMQTDDLCGGESITKNTGLQTASTHNQRMKRQKKQSIKFKFDRDDHGNMKLLEFAVT